MVRMYAATKSDQRRILKPTTTAHISRGQGKGQSRGRGKGVFLVPIRVESFEV